MTEQATQLDPEIMIPALVTSTKSTASVQSSSPITVDEQDWTQESTVGPKKLLCTPEYDSSYQTQGYTTNDNKNSELCTPNTRHSLVLLKKRPLFPAVDRPYDHTGRGCPPVPIPNTEVKPARAQLVLFASDPNGNFECRRANDRMKNMKMGWYWCAMGEFRGVFRVLSFFWTFDWSRPFLSKKQPISRISHQNFISPKTKLNK